MKTNSNHSYDLPPNELAQRLKQNFSRIWRCADSFKWNILKNLDLLTFDWINPDVDYKSIDINSLDRGKRALNPWVNELKKGDLIFVMGKNAFNGIGVAESEYHYEGPTIKMGESGDKPAISFKYIHREKEPKMHNISTHNNPTTFAAIDKYKFGLLRVLDYLKSDVPEAYSSLQRLVLKNESSSSNTKRDGSMVPQNLILYGPPGTGKTYSTKAFAVALAENGDASDHSRLNSKEHREECLEKFESLKAEGRVEFVTFHQSFAYEDFVQGIRPDVTQDKLAFDRVDGVFKVLSDRARRNYESSIYEKPASGFSFEDVFSTFMSDLVQDEVEEIQVPMRSKGYSFTITSYDPDEGRLKFRKQSGGTGHDLLKKNVKAIYEGQRDYGIEGLGVYYHPLVEKLREIAREKQLETPKESLKQFVLIIDEINRANISRVLGELITLLEPDKRLGAKDQLKIRLPSGEDFAVPSNLHIIGTMNTADKSIAHLDVALRRRFKFVPKYPEHFRASDNEKAEFLRKLNNYIAENYNADLTIGHSYFMNGKESIVDIMENKVMPLLNEYFNQQYDEIKEMLEKCGLAVQKKENGFGMLECTGYKSAGNGEST